MKEKQCKQVYSNDNIIKLHEKVMQHYVQILLGKKQAQKL